MKVNVIVLLVLFFSSSIAFAQKKGDVSAPDMPTDSITKLVSYTGVVEYPGVPKTELYKRALKWIKQYYPNANNMVQEKDSVAGKIVAKSQFSTHKTLKDGSKVASDLVQYTITLLFKDGKYKYEFTRLNIKGSSYIPIERYMDETSPDHEAHFNTLREADDTFTLMIDNMKERMSKPSAEPKKSDW